MILKIMINLLCMNNIFRSDSNFKGYDERFPKVENINQEELYNIKSYIEIKKLVKTLEDYNISTPAKMNILDKHSFLFDDSLAFDVTKGGLFDDYEMTID